MANTIDSNGLQLESLADIVTNLQESLKTIYGIDINFDSNSSDGQQVNIYAQSVRDNSEIVQTIYNNFDPDQSIGVIQDQYYALNNIQRKSGTYTTQEVDITVDRSLTLEGLDTSENPYKVRDQEGNEFVLLNTISIPSASVNSLNFRASELGEIITIPNTITTAVTIVTGVTDINNPNDATLIGTNEETDVEFRLRRTISTALSAKGYLDGLLGNVLNIDGVESANLFENRGSVTDANGIPGHSIWLIVDGGDDADIANAIYSLKTMAAGMKGDVIYNITQLNGDIFPAQFDRSLAKDLYIRFDIQETITGQTFNQVAIKTYISNNLTYAISEVAETSKITSIALDAIKSTGGGGVPLNIEISNDGISYVDFLEVDSLKERWNPDESRIDITIL